MKIQPKCAKFEELLLSLNIYHFSLTSQIEVIRTALKKASFQVSERYLLYYCNLLIVQKWWLKWVRNQIRVTSNMGQNIKYTSLSPPTHSTTPIYWVHSTQYTNILFFFHDFIYLFEKEGKSSGRSKGIGTHRLYNEHRAQHGTRSHDPEIQTWAEIKNWTQLTEPPSDP